MARNESDEPIQTASAEKICIASLALAMTPRVGAALDSPTPELS